MKMGIRSKSCIGRECLVRDFKSNALAGARVVDTVAGENRAKRVRLTTGANAGEVRMPGEYELVEFVEHGEAPQALAQVWAEEVMA